MSDFNTYELQARYTHVKSHYGKAMVIETEDVISLKSYSTIVARFYKDDDRLDIYGTYSNTTMRHLKDFINQHTPYYVDNNDDIRRLIKWN